MKRIKLIRGLCLFLPPLIAQKLRSHLISKKSKQEIKGEFRRKAFFGGNFIGNFNDFHSFRFYIHGYFEWRNVVLAYKIQKLKAGDIIEVGANVGTETVSLVKITGSNQLHAFEPVKENFSYLKAIKKINDYTNLMLYQNLVSDVSGIAFFKQPDPFNSGSGHITSVENKGTLKYQVVTLDEILSSINSCSLIMMDVEGFELNVLRGSRGLISRFKPYFIIEVNPLFLKERANINVSSLYKEIWEMGYECFYIEKWRIEKVEINEFQDKSNKNWLCIPIEDLKYKRQLSQTIKYNALNPFMNFRIF